MSNPLVHLTRTAMIVLATAAAAQAQPPRLHGRIANKQGTGNARQWTFEVRNEVAVPVTGVTIAAIQFTQTDPGGGPVCSPVARNLPLALGTLAAGASTSATVTTDFAGCSNTAKFNVQVVLTGTDGATGTIQRSNEYR